MESNIKDIDFDPNLFDSTKSKRFSVLTYTDGEVNKIILYLSNHIHTHPVTLPIRELMNALARFRAATTTDSDFVKMRLKSRTEKELRDTLQTMADALITAENKLKIYKLNSSDYEFFNSGFRYCLTNIRKRLKELKSTNDDFFIKYFSGSALEIALNQHQG